MFCNFFNCFIIQLCPKEFAHYSDLLCCILFCTLNGNKPHIIWVMWYSHAICNISYVLYLMDKKIYPYDIMWTILYKLYDMSCKFDSCLEHILNQLWLLRKIKLGTFLGSVFETPMPFKEMDQDMVASNSKNHLLIWSKNGPHPISSLRNCSNISPKSLSSF